jgi:hypothetical protein
MRRNPLGDRRFTHKSLSPDRTGTIEPHSTAEVTSVQ